MPDTPPKLPSIWNGGCASNQVGSCARGSGGTSGSRGRDCRPQPRPEIDAPGRRPPGGDVAAQLERLAGRGRQFGRATNVDVASRVESIKCDTCR